MYFVTSLSGLERREGHIHTVLSPTLQVALGIDYVMLVKAAFGVVQAQPTIWQFFTYVLRGIFPTAGEDRIDQVLVALLIQHHHMTQRAVPQPTTNSVLIILQVQRF